MPVIKSAIKKLRQDKKRESQNNLLRQNLKNAIRSARKTKTAKSVTVAIQAIDKASKKNLLHTNTAGRIKSSLSKLAKPTSIKSKTTTSKKIVKKAGSKKVSPKKSAKTKK